MVMQFEFVQLWNALIIIGSLINTILDHYWQSCVIQLFEKIELGVLQLLKFFEMCKNTTPEVDVQNIFTTVANEAVQGILLKYKVVFQRLFSMSMLRSKTQSYCIKIQEVVHLLKVVSLPPLLQDL